MDGSPGPRTDALLAPAYRAAHRALVRLEDADVPASLRRVRAASPRRTLPPPLRKVLAEALEEEWLRTLAVAELEDGDGPADEASRVFLQRPDGWEDLLASLVDAEHARSEQRDVETLRAEIERLRRMVDVATERRNEVEQRLQEAESAASRDERIEGLRRRLDIEERRRAGLETEIAAREETEARLRADLEEADERISQLRGRLTPSAGRSASSDRQTGAFGRGAPLETARLLDELVEATRPQPDSSELRTAREPLTIPRGIRPDAVEAVEWLRGVDRPVLVVVDGHNVAHDLGDDPGRTIRDRVVSETARLRRLAEAPLSVVVFFDSSHGEETHRSSGVAVRYVPDADEAIVATAAAATTDCVVFSTDKEVRRRVTEHGAVALWGTALSGWIRRA